MFDRDLQFRNEYARLYGLPEGSEIEEAAVAARLTTTGHFRNYMPVGPALLWAPAFLLVTALVWLADLFGAGYPLDGYARAFQAAAGFSGIAAAVAGTWLAYLAAACVADRRAAIWAALAIWLSSSALSIRSSRRPIRMRRRCSRSACSGSSGFARWIGRRLDATRRSTAGRRLGACAGRTPCCCSFAARRRVALATRRRLNTGTVAAAAGAAAIAFLPQMAVWAVLYGTPLIIPQGSGFMRWREPALWAILFSDNHGLITWTPVIALALLGLVPLARRNPLVGAAAIGFVAVSWYVNAAVSDWWAGEAFGARRFLSCYPVFVIGLAALFARLRLSAAGLAAVTTVFVAHTLLLLLQYQAFMHGLRHVVPYPRGFVDLWLWRFRAPFDLVRWWIER